MTTSRICGIINTYYFLSGLLEWRLYMSQQTGRTAALYYRTAAGTRTLEMHLVNQMHTLLCYARERGFDSFTLYADIDKSGATFDRPAFNALKSEATIVALRDLLLKGGDST